MHRSIFKKNKSSKAVKKLHQKAGETLAETLIALLISALALVMLAGAVTTSTKIVNKSKEKVNAYYSANEASNGVVQMSGTGDSATISISDTTSSDKLSFTPIPVTYYENDVFSGREVIAYKYSTSTSGG